MNNNNNYNSSNNNDPTINSHYNINNINLKKQLLQPVTKQKNKK